MKTKNTILALSLTLSVVLFFTGKKAITKTENNSTNKTVALTHRVYTPLMLKQPFLKHRTKKVIVFPKNICLPVCEPATEFYSEGTLLIKNKLNPRICFKVRPSLPSKEVSQKYTVSKLSNELTVKKLLIVNLETNLIPVANFLLPLL